MGFAVTPTTTSEPPLHGSLPSGDEGSTVSSKDSVSLAEQVDTAHLISDEGASPLDEVTKIDEDVCTSGDQNLPTETPAKKGDDEPAVVVVPKTEGEKSQMSLSSSVDNQDDTKSLLLSLQSSMNAQLQKQDEALKDHLQEMSKRLPAHGWCDQISKSLDNTATNTANLWKHCLEDRESITSIGINLKQVDAARRQLGGKVQNLENHQSQLSATTSELKTNFESLSAEFSSYLLTDSEQQSSTSQDLSLLKNQMEEMRKDISDLKGRNTQHFSSSTPQQHQPLPHTLASEIVSTKAQQQQLQVQLEQMKKDIASFANNATTNHQKNSSSKHRERSYVDELIEYPNLMLVDSNANKIDENRLGEYVACNKLYTPTWEDIKQMITQVQCNNPDIVEKIFIHVGTNNFDNSSAVQVCDVLEEGLGLLKRKFPKAEITMCSIIPRKNDEMVEEIRLVNEFLHGSKKRLGISLIDLGAVHHTMCYDRKHLNHDGVRILISAARFTFTGVFPGEPSQKNNRDQNDTRGRYNGGRNRRGRYRGRGGWGRGGSSD